MILLDFIDTAKRKGMDRIQRNLIQERGNGSTYSSQNQTTIHPNKTTIHTKSFIFAEESPARLTELHQKTT